MPNYITNILVCDNSEILESLLNIEKNVDFNIIIPMPKCVENTVCGSVIEYEDSSIKDYKLRDATRRPLTVDEIKDGAGEGWYDWSRRNWGTKWNAIDTKILHYDTFSFQTAWNPPHKFLIALSKKYPNETFYTYWKDEGSSGGLNEIIYLNGEKQND